MLRSRNRHSFALLSGSHKAQTSSQERGTRHVLLSVQMANNPDEAPSSLSDGLPVGSSDSEENSLRETYSQDLTMSSSNQRQVPLQCTPIIPMSTLSLYHCRIVIHTLIPNSQLYTRPFYCGKRHSTLDWYARCRTRRWRDTLSHQLAAVPIADATEPSPNIRATLWCTRAPRRSETIGDEQTRKTLKMHFVRGKASRATEQINILTSL